MPASKQRYSRWDKTVIWDHPAEVHIDPDTGCLTPEYRHWREKGMTCPYPIRYPVGFHHRHKCSYAVKDLDNPIALDYIQSRKEIYLPVYAEMVRKRPQYKELLSMLKSGTNLLIVEVDGPHEESLPYYKKHYGVSDDFIDKGSMLCTEENLEIMLNDKRHNFGHGYCLARCLLENLDD